MYVVKLKQAVTDLTLPVLRRDTLLSGDNNGVRYLFDLAFKPSYVGGTPSNVSTVSDVAEIGAASPLTVQSDDSVAYAGGGFDFNATTKFGNQLTIPASVAADIWSSANQYYLACLYIKLPTLANWNSSTNIAELLRFSSGTYIDSAEMSLLAFKSGGILSARRQTALNSVVQQEITPAAGDYGNFAQVAMWRNASGQGFRLKTANGVILTNASSGANNSANFSALTCKVGVLGGGFNPPAGNLLSSLTGASNAYKMRLYRMFVENLVRSGRNPASVLDADWERTIARAAFS